MKIPTFESSAPGKSRWLAAAATFVALTACASILPPNLALSARATATSEYSSDHRAQFAVDGKIQSAGLRDDAGKAWCVRGDTHRNGADLTLEWTNAVTVAEVVYYGRTAWFAEECWKDCELLAEGAPTTVARSTFRMGHGPQRLRLAEPIVTRRLTLHFTSSYGGLNPRAAEVQNTGSSLKLHLGVDCFAGK